MDRAKHLLGYLDDVTDATSTIRNKIGGEEGDDDANEPEELAENTEQ